MGRRFLGWWDGLPGLGIAVSKDRSNTDSTPEVSKSCRASLSINLNYSLPPKAITAPTLMPNTPTAAFFFIALKASKISSAVSGACKSDCESVGN